MHAKDIAFAILEAFEVEIPRKLYETSSAVQTASQALRHREPDPIQGDPSTVRFRTSAGKMFAALFGEEAFQIERDKLTKLGPAPIAPPASGGPLTETGCV